MNQTVISDMENTILFSGLSGCNYYTVDFLKDGEYLGKHCPSGERVDIRFSDSFQNTEQWRHVVEYPADITSFLWPLDIVRYYDGKDQRLGMVFRHRNFPKMLPIRYFLYQDDGLDWRREPVQKFVRNFLQAMVRLHKSGYAYLNFNMEHILYDPKTMDLLFDFTSSVMPVDLRHVRRSREVPFTEMALEFLPPWLALDQPNQMDLVCEYYSIAAMLFRVMVGRMPYQGRLMDGHGNMMNLQMDTDAIVHRRMFEVYLQHPRFIFDPEEKENTIGLFENEKKYKERWRALPEAVQAMFQRVLSQKNVQASNWERKYYSAETWLEVLTAQQCLAEKEG